MKYAKTLLYSLAFSGSQPQITLVMRNGIPRTSELTTMIKTKRQKHERSIFPVRGQDGLGFFISAMLAPDRLRLTRLA